MKRPSYRHGIEIIALNDDPSETDLQVVASQLTVQLLSDLFEVDAEKVAHDVLKARQNGCR